MVEDRTLELVAEAARAPSAHNAQPARWRFLEDGRVLLFEDESRRLTVADPDGRDASIGLGATFEGLDIALSRSGHRLRLLGPARECGSPDGPLRPAAEAVVERGGELDRLAAWVHRRRTHRGTFSRPDGPTLSALRHFADSASDLHPIHEREEIEEWARIHDAAAYRFLRRPEYQAELFRWMRFSPRNPAWHQDGLTTECLGLSAIQGVGAGILFRPRFFGVLKAMGLGRVLTSEAEATRSASALLIFHRPQEERAFDSGRRFYRIWLELTRLGLRACPMSALADDPDAARQLAGRFGLDTGSRVVSVFRVGAGGNEPPPRSSRLSPEELLV